MSGRHRSADRDPVSDVLARQWVLGHAVVLGLLSIPVQHAVEADALDRAGASASVPDTPPPA
ncbi:hypothetical protein BG452_11070 [Streptomyces sp. CBMA123]|nr:hypothetical protein [Streptomyces sp. CBMA123]